MYNVIDLFCSCGGLSYGFQSAGFNILLGVDNDSTALDTFNLNHNGGKGINLDLYDHKNLLKIKELVDNKTIDFIVGGPPCQGFSLSGPRQEFDSRNTLYESFLKCVEIYKPKGFLIENVPGIINLYGGKVINNIIEWGESMGYVINYKVLTAADYGVPQTRRRAFIIGFKKDYGKFSFPEAVLSPDHYINCEDAISDLPSREGSIGLDTDNYDGEPTTIYQKKMRGKSKTLFNHVGTIHSEKVTNVISLVPEGGNHKDLPEGIGSHRKFNEAWTRYHSKKPSKTIDTGHRNHFHYKYNRVPTVRENARLQSFPDEFQFVGSKTHQYKQVGNAVPPLLAEYIASFIYKHLEVYNDKKNN